MLATPVTRTVKVNQVADQGNGQVAVQLAVQPATNAAGAVQAAGSNATLVLSAAEWNEIAGQASGSGTNGVGVSLTLTLQ